MYVWCGLYLVWYLLRGTQGPIHGTFADRSIRSRLTGTRCVMVCLLNLLVVRVRSPPPSMGYGTVSSWHKVALETRS